MIHNILFCVSLAFGDVPTATQCTIVVTELGPDAYAAAFIRTIDVEAFDTVWHEGEGAYVHVVLNHEDPNAE